jgi:hypothetical protein
MKGLVVAFLLAGAADVPLMPNADSIPEVIAWCTLHNGNVQCRKFFFLMTRGACGTIECAQRLKGIPL